MKKFLITLLYASIFLSTNFTGAKTDAYAKIEDTSKIAYTEKIETSISNIEKDFDEQQKAIEEEERIKAEEEAKAVQTSAANNYSYSYVPTETYGTYGRLYISGYNAALYDYNVYTNSDLSLQQIVDNWDSAAYYISRDKLVIADHDTQGFSVLTWIPEGTTAYIKFADGSTIGYRLTRKSKGYNTGPDLIDAENNSFFNMDSDIIMYTCYEDGIMVTLWSLL